MKTIPIISVAFIDERGVQYFSFDLLRTEDGVCRSAASVSFKDGIPTVNFTIKALALKKQALIRLARKYERRAIYQTFHKTILPQ